MESFPYWQDTRSQQQKTLSNLLIDRLSDFNMKLNENKQYSNLHSNKNILTITINGIPRNDNQWVGFNFPGKVINYVPPGFEIGMTEEFYCQRLKKANVQDVLFELNEIIDNHGGKVIFAVHSFGCFMSTIYAYHYPHKVVGLIEFGGVPIRVYTLFKLVVKIIMQVNKQLNFDLGLLIKQKDRLYTNYVEYFKTSKMNIIDNSYNLIAFLVWFKKTFLLKFWGWRRNLSQKLLKLIAFGRSDKVFEPTLLNQMAVHFAFEKPLDQTSNNKLWKIYQSVTQSKVPQIKNIQQRFVYSFIKTGHGPHLVKKSYLQNLINLYLSIVLVDIENKSNL